MTGNVEKALNNIERNISHWEQRSPIPFAGYLDLLVDQPERVLRNAFQVFHDLIATYISEGVDEYPDDPESIHFVYYDCNRLFVEGSDQPFFADRLFANRLVNLAEALKRGAQQNKIYIFEGPHGCGKSTFLNNLLSRFERYANTEEGARFETVWSLPPSLLEDATGEADKLEVTCPSHDNPILLIPKTHRRRFLEDLFASSPFLERLQDKEYEWVFRSEPCTICGSLYQALLARLGSSREVLRHLYARPYHFNRRLSEGISVFNPGDKPLKQPVLTNEMVQNRINETLRDSNLVRYVFSRYAKTNNGIYALMDIKSHNTDRLIELHNVISEGVHKVEDIEENVSSIFIALMNPEDKSNIKEFPSFSDRIEYIKVPYVLDLGTEVEIYRNIFGRHIDESFLPMVLQNFGRVIISSRLAHHSEAMAEWIRDPSRYALYCDENLLLLKMEIYTGNIPKWLDEEDRKRLTAKRRRRIIAESETEGDRGFSGRDSIRIFNEFYSTFARRDRLINMSALHRFFTRLHTELEQNIPEGFLDSLLRMYDYTILQEVKESLYYYNEERISRDIQNYLFAVSFEPGSVETCRFTGERLEMTEDFFHGLETRLLGAETSRSQRLAFRQETQKEYTAETLTQEIMSEGKNITQTRLYHDLHGRYVYNLKEKVLDPFLENENFRRALKDFDNKESFKTYDRRIRGDVTFLVNNLCRNFHYTRQGAKDICMYVIDNRLAQKFSNH